MNPNDYLPLPPVAFEVLLSLSRGPQHGYGMIQEIRKRTDGAIDLATSSLYATIRRLEDEGFVRESAPPDEASEGPARKYYAITKQGLTVARAEALRVQKLARVAGEWLLDGGNA